MHTRFVKKPLIFKSFHEVLFSNFYVFHLYPWFLFTHINIYIYMLLNYAGATAVA
jgi:hypothetical protein